MRIVQLKSKMNILYLFSADMHTVVVAYRVMSSGRPCLTGCPSHPLVQIVDYKLDWWLLGHIVSHARSSKDLS
jgi:hypothetical protein